MHVAPLRQDFVFNVTTGFLATVDMMSMRPRRRRSHFFPFHFRQLSSRGEESVRVSMDDFASLALAARGADGCLVRVLYQCMPRIGM